jgi:hypothetical protein
VIVNVCPAAMSSARPDRLWQVITTPERFEDWQDARFVRAEPPGPVRAGQVIKLAARGYGRKWPVTIDVLGLDSNRRWIDLRVHLPLGIINEEHVTLSESDQGGTLVRFN